MQNHEVPSTIDDWILLHHIRYLGIRLTRLPTTIREGRPSHACLSLASECAGSPLVETVCGRVLNQKLLKEVEIRAETFKSALNIVIDTVGENMMGKHQRMPRNDKSNLEAPLINNSDGV